MILFLVVFLWATGVIVWSVNKIILKGKSEYAILFMCLYLPPYTAILSVVYTQFHSPLAVNLFQYAKEFIIFLTLLSLALYKRDFFSYRINFKLPDRVFLAFIALAAVYAILPLGEAGVVQKIIYFKNIFLLGIAYFLGRMASPSDDLSRKIIRVLYSVAIAAFLLNVIEYAIGTHFQSFTGYAEYNDAINGTDPTGSYGLSWTFETQSTQKRLASFFSNPLDLASAALLIFPLALISFILVKGTLQKGTHLIIMGVTLLSLLFAISRAALGGIFLQLVAVAIIFRFYKLLLGAGVLSLLGLLYITFFASRDFRDFAYDTVTFQNASSVGHVISWLEGAESMIDSPMGIGLAMSGNAGGVDDALRVGGENQFIIFGVQLGFVGLFLYIALLMLSVVYSFKAYKASTGFYGKVISFTAAAAKIGLLLPLFTSNVEIYLFVALVSWWLAGHSIGIYYSEKAKSTGVIN